MLLELTVPLKTLLAILVHLDIAVLQVQGFQLFVLPALTQWAELSLVLLVRQTITRKKETLTALQSLLDFTSTLQTSFLCARIKLIVIGETQLALLAKMDSFVLKRLSMLLVS